MPDFAAWPTNGEWGCFSTIWAIRGQISHFCLLTLRESLLQKTCWCWYVGPGTHSPGICALLYGLGTHNLGVLAMRVYMDWEHMSWKHNSGTHAHRFTGTCLGTHTLDTHGRGTHVTWHAHAHTAAAHTSSHEHPPTIFTVALAVLSHNLNSS